MKRGLTMIELMIIVSIIAIITAIAIPNLLRGKMASMEAAAVMTCKAYTTAQNTFRRVDYDDDMVLEYAQELYGNGEWLGGAIPAPGGSGKRDGLFVVKNGTMMIQMIDLAFGMAQGNPDDPTVVPKVGYVFRIQYADATTGSYLGGSRMNLGFGLSATPQSYDATGRSCFQVSSAGIVCMKDLGSQTNVNAFHRTNSYNPQYGGNWALTE